MKTLTPDILFDSVRQLLAEGRNVVLQVEGNSMRPYFRGDGSEQVVVAPVSPGSLQPGNIILFSYGNQYVFHRIVRKKAELLYAQGDGNCFGTETVAPREVLGIVCAVVRRGGKTLPTQTLWTGLYWRLWYWLRPGRKYLLRLCNRLLNY
jgi:hypothetical protein